METVYSISGEKRLSEYGEYFIEFLKNGIQEGKYFSDNNYPEDSQASCIDRIKKTCFTIEENFKKIKRQTGEYREYHSHLYEVATLYLKYSGENASLEGLIIALRHDDIEDLHPDSKKQKIVEFINILNEDGIYCAVGVQALSKPKVPHIDETRRSSDLENKAIKTIREEQKNNRDSDYYSDFVNIESIMKLIQRIMSSEVSEKVNNSEIEKLARDIAVIRICDRIHNLRTMPEDGYDNNKRLRKLQNTDMYLLHLAKSLMIPELYTDLVSALLFGYKTYFKIKERAIL